MTKAWLQKLRNLYNPSKANLPLPQALVELTLRQKAKANDTLQHKENKLYKHKYNKTTTESNATWAIPDILYDALHNYFIINRVIQFDPITLPLRAKYYISHDPHDITFGAISYTHTAWLDTSLAIPDHTPDKLTRALEQALYNAHAHRHTRPSSQILILPD